MKEDAVTVEVRKARDEYAKKFGDDIDAIADDFKSRQGKDGAPIISRLFKRIAPRNTPR